MRFPQGLEIGEILQKIKKKLKIWILPMIREKSNIHCVHIFIFFALRSITRKDISKGKVKEINFYNIFVNLGF